MRKLLILHNAAFYLNSARLMKLGDDYPDFTIDYHPSSNPPPEAMAEAEVIFGCPPADRLPEAGNLRWLHLHSAGAGGYCNPALYRRPDIIVTKSSGAYGAPIAEHVLAMFFALSRRFGWYAAKQRGHEWARNIDDSRELTGSTVLILGAGDIGTELARLLKPFGCTRIGYKRNVAIRPPHFDDIIDRRGLHDALARADYIAVCLPGTPGTAGLLGPDEFAVMKPGAILANIGRGSVVDTAALIEALRSGRLYGAGLDVTDPEPLPPDNPLWDMENVIITPHIAPATPSINDRRMKVFTDLMDRYAAGKTMWNRVDFFNGY